MSGDEQRGALAVRAALIESTITGLIDECEKMAHGSSWGPEIFELGLASGYLRGARALVEVARMAIARVLNHRERRDPATPNAN